MKLGPHDIAVCSWSLRPHDTQDLAEKVRSLGLRHVQLALGHLIQLDDRRKAQQLGHLRGLEFTAGMIAFPGEDYSTIEAIRRTGGFAPGGDWPIRRRLTREAGRLAVELGIRIVSTHVGFIPPPEDPEHQEMISRVRETAADFAKLNLELAMETGQERADELLAFLQALNAPNVGVNFDPANMLLYGAGDPIAAVGTLAGHIRHVHVKDALESKAPGREWGREVPFGAGQVNPAAFLTALRAIGYVGPLAIEREAGDSRMEDVRTAIGALERNV